ncbi:MAG: hypothetical protein E7813_05475 [Bradyrhizobium sp.]|uniref:hypothetical protein n=1 Tax=Bradyrhizobium sp. TaxID=376 RepID=UPI0011F7B039|nr:hypothetical protein [Bradyrhizobium sp.]THD71463.1 MAG: hypothetical protein E7813_05475 [Bradyrhizobium sp.]
MAAITFNTEARKEQIRNRIQTAFATYREMLDTFVSNRVRQAAAAAERARPRQALDATSPDKAGAGAARAHFAMIKRFCISAFTVVAATCALAAMMALKILVYLPHSHS